MINWTVTLNASFAIAYLRNIVENENAAHHPNVGTRSAMSRAEDVIRPALSQHATVAAEHRATVVIKFTNLRDLNQNQRSKNQYPEAPKAEATDRAMKGLSDSQSTLSSGNNR